MQWPIAFGVRQPQVQIKTLPLPCDPWEIHLIPLGLSLLMCKNADNSARLDLVAVWGLNKKTAGETVRAFSFLPFF